MTRYDSHKLQRFKSSAEPFADSSRRETPRSLRSSISAKNFTAKCFFCNQIVEDDVLHQCQTLFMDAHMRMIALEVGDTKLFAKPREEDMAAAEAVYHLNCFKKLSICTEATKIGKQVIETTWR